MSIFDVRSIAKEVGVSAPTKLNKGDLMELIYKISNGLMEPPVPPKLGRPRKRYPGESGEDVVTDNNKAIGEDGYVADAAKDEVQEEPVQSERGEAAKPVYRDRREKKNYQEPQTKSPFILEFNNSTAPTGRKPHEVPQGQVGLREEKELIREGYLEVSPDNYGFLRVVPGECSDMDAYVNSSKIRQFNLRKGDYVVAKCRKGIDDTKPAPLNEVITINGVPWEEAKNRPNFDTLTPIYPDSRLRLEVPNRPREYAMRCIDLVSPIGKGQRAIIVSPPKAGKTTLLKMIAGSIATNYPDVVLKVLLIDERPEEVTDMQRSIKGEVVYSTFDELPEHHTKTAEMLLERCKRLVESGKDVVILLDSLTRLARAYNLTIPPTGRTLSGGIDPGALHSPKRFFGSARNLEANKDKGFKGGSLTIIATALIETGSRMDDVIFEEFKGTGNMEIHLDRKLSEKRIFPAIDLSKSSTRKEELLLTTDELGAAFGIRRLLSSADNAESTENLINMIVKTSSNQEFITQLNLTLKLGQKEGYSVRQLYSKPSGN